MNKTSHGRGYYFQTCALGLRHFVGGRTVDGTAIFARWWFAVFCSFLWRTDTRQPVKVFYYVCAWWRHNKRWCLFFGTWCSCKNPHTKNIYIVDSLDEYGVAENIISPLCSAFSISSSKTSKLRTFIRMRKHLLIFRIMYPAAPLASLSTWLFTRYRQVEVILPGTPWCCIFSKWLWAVRRLSCNECWFAVCCYLSVIGFATSARAPVPAQTFHVCAAFGTFLASVLWYGIWLVWMAQCSG